MNRRFVPSLALAAACAVAVLPGCGSQVAGPPASPASPVRPAPARPGVSTASHAAWPRQRAAADAARIMADFPRPPGAVRTGLIASLTNPVVEDGDRGHRDGDALVAGTGPAAGRAVLDQRAPAARVHPGRFRLRGLREPTGALVESRGDMFALPPVPGVLPQRELVATVMSYRGQTALRTDAQVAWLPPGPRPSGFPPASGP